MQKNTGKSIQKEIDLYSRMRMYVKTRIDGKEHCIMASGRDALPLKSRRGGQAELYYITLCVVV
jgi:hypothetical protein